MAQEYASKQPQGFKNQIQNVAIVGAGGQIGKYVVEALLKEGKHKVTAISRNDSKAKIPSGVEVKRVDYSDQDSIVAALKGQDILIITMAFQAGPDQQTKLIDAAAAAGISWVVPNEWGYDASEQVGIDTMLGPARRAVRDHIVNSGMSWTGIGCGFWYEFSMAGGPIRYGFDVPNRKATFYGDGTRKLSTSTFPRTGLAVSRLLALKVLPEDESDKSATLSEFRNKFVHFASFTINQQEMLESFIRVTGTTAADWEVTHNPVEEVFAKAKKDFLAGNREAFGTMLYSRYFFPDNPGNMEIDGLDNAKLGLEQDESLDEYTKVALNMIENKYFEGLY